MEPARGEPRWLILDEAHVPALGSEAGSFDYGGQNIRWIKAVAIPRIQPGRPRPIQLCGGFAARQSACSLFDHPIRIEVTYPRPPQLLGVGNRVNAPLLPPLRLA